MRSLYFTQLYAIKNPMKISIETHLFQRGDLLRRRLLRILGEADVGPACCATTMWCPLVTKGKLQENYRKVVI